MIKPYVFYEQLYKTGSKLKGWQSWGILENQRQAQWHSAEAIERQSTYKLRKMLQHAYRNTVYYRTLFDAAGVVGADGNVKLERFRDIPFLDKNSMREAGESMLAKGNYAGGQWNKSGGSTGEPGRFYQDETYRDYSRANKFLFDEWTGTRIGDKRLWLWGSDRDLFQGKDSMTVRLGNWVNRRVQLNSYRMSADRMVDYISTINKFKPVQILSYVQSIEELTRFIEKKGLSVYSPKSIMVTAGTLYPDVREKVEKVFGAPIFNRYGSREVGDIASECEHHRGLHTLPNTQYLEILRADGTPCEPGEVGEIVVTLLTNYAMPLIRYRIGDMGVWAEHSCTCGRHSRLLQTVTGRVVDQVRTRDGGVIDGTIFNKLFYARKWVTKFQVVQEEMERFTISIVPDPAIGDPRVTRADEIAEIEDLMEQATHYPLQIDFNFCEDIPPSPSGKYRYVISKVNQ